MADTPQVELVFGAGCPDCGSRRVNLPRTLPALGDDFDWLLRDYDGFRLFMLEELAARYPERRRWTPADLEVVLVEVLSAVLDQLSDTLDRTAAEACLETARRPESVRRLLRMIGYDAVGLLQRQGLAPFDRAVPTDGDGEPLLTPVQRLEQYWLDQPERMDQARQAGPRAIHTQHRMVTLEDAVNRAEEHPLVLRAQANETWGGSWSLIRLAVIPWERADLDGRLLLPGDSPAGSDRLLPDEIWEQVVAFHRQRDLFLPRRDSRPSIRSLLRHYIDDYRMLGQQLQLVAAVEVGILLSLSVQVDRNYFQSEVRHAVDKALGTGPEGFFAAGRLRFGEDLWAGDLFETLMALDGVDNVCLNRFKRIGDRYADASDHGRIALSGLEVAVCDNRAEAPERGYYLLRVNGGRSG
jgi:hypothetical protein